MLKWIKDLYIKGEAKIKFIAYDDSVSTEEIEPYEEFAIIPYEGEYDELIIKMKLRKFVRATKNHLVVEMIIVERVENGKIIKL